MPSSTPPTTRCWAAAGWMARSTAPPGAQLLAETRTLGGCKTGDAKISGGYKLKARHVIHTVGPVYRANDPDVPRKLASAYRRSLEVAARTRSDQYRLSGHQHRRLRLSVG